LMRGSTVRMRFATRATAASNAASSSCHSGSAAIGPSGRLR
jgi:hypothetical protein